LILVSSLLFLFGYVRQSKLAIRQLLSSCKYSVSYHIKDNSLQDLNKYETTTVSKFVVFQKHFLNVRFMSLAPHMFMKHFSK